MRKLSLLSIFGICLFVLTGCPIGLDYPLGYKGEEKNDAKLYGAWEINDPEETVLAFKVTRKTENTMQFTVLEPGELFTPNTYEFTGWIVSLGGMRFLCLSEDAEPNAFYHYVIHSVSETEFKISDLTLLDGGLDAVTSQENLRKEVLSSMKKPNFLDGAITYTKMR